MTHITRPSFVLLALLAAAASGPSYAEPPYYDPYGRRTYIDPSSGAAYVIDAGGTPHALDAPYYPPGPRLRGEPSRDRYDTQRYWNNDMQYGSGACLSRSDC